MNKEEAEFVFRSIADEARRRKNGGETIPHLFFLLIPKMPPMMIAVSDLLRMEPGFTKDDVANFVKNASACSGARYVVQLTEAWCLKAVEEPNHDVEISKHPDRKEIIMVTIDGVDCNGTILMDIENDRVVGEPQVLVGSFTGRFSNMSGNVGIN